MTILIAILALGSLSFLLALVLAIANQKFYVYEDPRIDAVEDLLPHANCGACGFPGCRPFAEALVGNQVLPSKCTVSSEEGKQEIASFLGVDMGSEDKIVARLACAGGTNVARNRANYKGVQTCAGSTLISGGGKSCFWGCLGHGDCETACDFDAIEMDAFSLPKVDVDKCTACGDCVISCPKDLFSLQPLKNNLWVNCKNLQLGDKVLDDCKVGCTACGKCAMDAPDGQIAMVDNLPLINNSVAYQKKETIDRCPTGAIVWYEQDGSYQKGVSSSKVIRKSNLKPRTS